MDKQNSLFEMDDFSNWAEYWVDMPAYNSKNEKPFDSINVQFSCAEDRKKFLKMLGENEERRKSIWFPSVPYLMQSQKVKGAIKVAANKYPIYIISKGRHESRLTAKALENLGIDYHIVVEPQEFDLYASVIDDSKIITTPFSNLGQGSIPSRNFVWQHSIEAGHSRHWILDDNLNGFYRLNNNLKTKVINENPFTSIENFVDRYENITMAGMNYEFFADRRSRQPPVRFNTRIYSCILLANDLSYKWRGRYNEDTDLSIRMLKDGNCTALFNHYLCKKMPTMKMKGGNTDELYQQDDKFDGRYEMAASLMKQHPDIVRLSMKWGRWQHHVDYSSFRFNRLKKL